MLRKIMTYYAAIYVSTISLTVYNVCARARARVCVCVCVYTIKDHRKKLFYI